MPRQPSLRESFWSGLLTRSVTPFWLPKWTAFLQKYPSDSRLDRVHYYLGICQLHTKKYADAVKTFQTVLSKYPSFADADAAQYNLGMAYFQQAGASKKVEDLRSAADALGIVAHRRQVASGRSTKGQRGQGLAFAGFE